MGATHVNMEILIVSDSHGNGEVLNTIAERHKDIPIKFHCGDSELSYHSSTMEPFKKVKGNCDFDDAYPNEFMEEYKGIRFYVTHGHLYNVKQNPLHIIYKAQEIGADIVCFGHSHIAGAEYSNGVLLVNPGSILLPRGGNEKTYAICKINTEGNISIKFMDQNGNEVKKWTREFTINN